MFGIHYGLIVFFRSALLLSNEPEPEPEPEPQNTNPYQTAEKFFPVLSNNQQIRSKHASKHLKQTNKPTVRKNCTSSLQGDKMNDQTFKSPTNQGTSKQRIGVSVSVSAYKPCLSIGKPLGHSLGRVCVISFAAYASIRYRVRNNDREGEEKAEVSAEWRSHNLESACVHVGRGIWLGWVLTDLRWWCSVIGWRGGCGGYLIR
ncbi:hypothetical protein VTL71DRAFT_205, partial [Oculimacula yallundae]